MMTKEELVKKLQDIEWEDFEVKEAAFQLPKTIWDTVSSFANTGGGWIVLGVEQRGKKFNISGVADPEKMEQEFTTVLRGDKFSEKIIPIAKRYDFDGKTVLAFYISVSKKRLVYFNSLFNTFIRTGSGDQRATKEEINSMYRDQAFGTQTDKTITGSDISWVNKKTLSSYRDFVNEITQVTLTQELKILISFGS